MTADQAIIDRVTCLPHVQVFENFKVTEFGGDKNLSSLTIRRKASAETRTLPVNGAFVAIGMEPNSSLVGQLVERNVGQKIMIKSDCSTSRAGIFAAGDVTDSYGKRIPIASGEAVKAALAARQYLLNLRRAVCLQGVRQK